MGKIPFNYQEIENKRVLVRTDYDVPLRGGNIEDESRILASLPTIQSLIKYNAKTISIICHLGRPDGKYIPELSIKPIEKRVREIIVDSSSLVFEENLRFNPGEEANDQLFAQELALKGDLFINEAFAVSHRKHASIVGIPKYLPSYIGIHFNKEIAALDQVIKNPKKPLIIVLGGAKLETKLPLIQKMEKLADVILVGGKLAHEIIINKIPLKDNVIVAELNSSGKDISRRSAHRFSKIIYQAGTVVWNGPMGVYEEAGSGYGTKIIARAVNSTQGYSVIGGGDTEAAATIYHAEANLDHISIGGGAMLTYLTDGTLPGLKAIKGGQNGESSN